MYRLFLDLKIGTKIAILSFLLVVIPVIFLSAFFYRINSQSFEAAVYTASKEHSEYIAEQLGVYFRQLDKAFSEIYNVADINNILDIIKNGYNQDPEEYLGQKNSIENYFSYLLNNHPGICRAVLINKRNEVIDYWSREEIFNKKRIVRDDLNYRPIFEISGNRPLLYSYYDNIMNRNILVYARNINRIYKDDKLGSIAFLIDLDSLKGVCEKYNYNGSISFVVNGEDEIIYSTYTGQTAKLLGQEEKAMFLGNSASYKISDYKNRRVLSLIPGLSCDYVRFLYVYSLDEVEKNKINGIKATITIVILLTLLIVLVSFFFTRIITVPLKKLCEYMKKVQNGNFDISIPENERNDEISILKRSFNFMIKKIKAMIDLQYKYEIQYKDAQLLILQSQINPHFLYNTLQTIGGRAILNDNYEVNQMCRSLSDIFRYNMRAESNEALIEDEICHINNFLYIEKIRFQDMLLTRMEIDDSLRKCRILRMILQPVIENAIVHGLEKGDLSRVNVDIYFKRVENDITITVDDDGKGIDGERLEWINGRLDADTPGGIDENGAGSTSIGIHNVNTRMRLFYGERYGLKIFRREPRGVRAQLMIPYRKD